MENLPRKRNSFQHTLDHYQVKKDQEIKRLTEQIGSVTSQLKEYKVALVREGSELERKRLNHKIILLDQRRQWLKDRLIQLGYKDKRGRPKKITGDTYKGQRIKFTAHLLPENMEYLKQLKEIGTVDNISAYLDELIQLDRKKKMLER